MEKADTVLSHLRDVVVANTTTMSILGAQVMVLRKFYDIALPYLSASRRGEIVEAFRKGIEDAMALTDDVALPAEYHSALLNLTNSILASLADGPTV